MASPPPPALARRLPNLPLRSVRVGVFKGFSILEVATAVVGEFCCFSSTFRRGWLVLYGRDLEQTVICFKRGLLKLQTCDGYGFAVGISVVARRLEPTSKHSEDLEFSVSFNPHRRLEV